MRIQPFNGQSGESEVTGKIMKRVVQGDEFALFTRKFGDFVFGPFSRITSLPIQAAACFSKTALFDGEILLRASRMMPVASFTFSMLCHQGGSSILPFAATVP